MSRPQSIRAALPGLGHILSRFWPYIRRQRMLVAGSSVAMLAEVVFRLLEPWPLKFVFDRVIPTTPADGIGSSFVEALSPSWLLAFSAISLVLIIGLRALAAYLSTVGFALVGNRVLTEVRRDVYSHLQRLSLSFHSKARGGDLVMRVIGDIGMLKEVAVTALLPLMGNVLVLIGMLGVMFWLHWQLALVSLAALPLFWLATMRIGKSIQEVARKQRKREGALASTVSESLSAIKVVQILSLEPFFEQAFSGQNQKDLREGVRSKRLAAGLERTVDLFIAVATALVLWYGARLTLRGELTPGDLLIFFTYLKNAFRPVRDLAKYTGRLAKASAAGERVIDLLEQKPDIRDLPWAKPAPAFKGALSFEHVSFAYETGTPILRGMHFSVQPGQRVAIVGPSGNGKSTIANLLLRLYDPQKGKVRIDGEDIREFTLASLRGQISTVMQDSMLFATSVRENIAFGMKDVTPEQVEAAARLANADGFIRALPQGYDTILGERGATLSNGQRQRIAIARAAIRNAPILLLDEPTTGLDAANVQTVISALDRLAQGRTTLLITHDLQHAAQSDLILFVEGGRIAEAGTHAELMRVGGRYAQLYWRQTNDQPALLQAEVAYAPVL